MLEKELALAQRKLIALAEMPNKKLHQANASKLLKDKRCRRLREIDLATEIEDDQLNAESVTTSKP